MPGSFQITGFNDAFPSLSFLYGQQAFQKAHELRGTTVRFFIDWAKVQPSGPYDWYWDGYENGNPNAHHYEQTVSFAAQNQLNVILIFLGTPSWTSPESSGGGTYPSEYHTTNYFGKFVVEAIRHYRALGPLAAVEVWNEPNNLGFPSYMPSSRYKKMLSQVLNDVNGAVGQGTLAPISVLGGSFAMTNNGLWGFYLNDIDNQCWDWGLSIHPYCNSPQTGSGTANEITDKVTTVINWPKTSHITGIWVTETGAPSRSPVGEPGQKEAMTTVCNWLSQQSQIRSMLIHQLYDPLEPNGTPPFNTYPVLNQNWSHKQVADALLAGQIW